MVSIVKPRSQVDPIPEIGTVVSCANRRRAGEIGLTDKESTAKSQSASNEDGNKYPTFKEAMSRAARDGSFAEERVRRVDIRFGAAGDGVYRVWIGGDDEWLAGVLPGP